MTFLLEKVMQRVSQNLHIGRNIHRLRRDVIWPERVSQLGIAECNTVYQCHSWGSWWWRRSVTWSASQSRPLITQSEQLMELRKSALPTKNTLWNCFSSEFPCLLMISCAPPCQSWTVVTIQSQTFHYFPPPIHVKYTRNINLSCSLRFAIIGVEL